MNSLLIVLSSASHCYIPISTLKSTPTWFQRLKTSLLFFTFITLFFFALLSRFILWFVFSSIYKYIRIIRPNILLFFISLWESWIIPRVTLSKDRGPIFHILTISETQFFFSFFRFFLFLLYSFIFIPYRSSFKYIYVRFLNLFMRKIFSSSFFFFCYYYYCM